MASLGYREGRNLIIERRYAAGDLERLAPLAAELVRADVDVIVTQTTPAALAAKRATASIPIVMATGGDAVRSGLVASLAQPGGNVTGMTFLGTETVQKALQLALELKPGMKRIAFLGNAAIVPEQISFHELQKTGAALGIEATFADTQGLEDFEPAFATIMGMRADAVYVAPSAAFTDRRERIVGLAAQHKLLALYGRREFVDAGGLVSYGTNFSELFRQAAAFVDKILKGAKPQDLPVEQPTKFELVINLTAAKGLGLKIPDKLLALADEVIE